MKFKNAKNYDNFALPQIWAAKKLMCLLSNFNKNFDCIYEIGCGSGILTKMILQELKPKNLILNDLYKSQIMQNFNYEIGDICKISLPKNLDLVLSSSVFQWIKNLNNLAEKIHFSLNTNGICAFSMLIKDSLFELSSFTKQSLEYKNLDEIKQIFSENFEILAFENDVFVNKFDDLRSLLLSLKETGVNNIKGNFILNKSSLALLQKHFANEFRLSFNYIFVIAKRRIK